MPPYDKLCVMLLCLVIASCGVESSHAGATKEASQPVGAMHLGHEPSSTGPIVVVDGYFADGNADIRIDVERTRDAYRNSGYQVVDVSNRSHVEIRRALEEVRRNDPLSFQVDASPIHYVSIGHGSNGGNDGTILTAWQMDNAGIVQYRSDLVADRAIAAIEGAGPDSRFHILVSACHAGAMIGCQRQGFADVRVQIVGIHAAVGANEWAAENEEQSEVWLADVLSGLTYDRQLDRNKDGLLTLGEVIPTRYPPSYTTVDSFVRVPGVTRWETNAPFPPNATVKQILFEPIYNGADRPSLVRSTVYEWQSSPQSAGVDPILSRQDN